MLEELIHHPMRKSRREKEAGGGGESGKGKANKETSLPVFEVEKAIERIGTLLQLGLGEAGAKIISENMRAGNIMLDQVTCSSDRINALESFYQIEYGFNHDGPTHRFESKQGGALVHAIFGFCDIRNFTDTTECLQEEVMLFVNRIAHILHGIVVQCKGAANKNIGDAFLLTWKLHENQMVPGGAQEVRGKG